MLDPQLAGTYDAILTRELADIVRGLPAERVIKKALEGEVAPDLLSRHLAFLVRSAIRNVKGETVSEQALERVKLSNQLLRALQQVIPEAIEDSDFINEDSENRLWAITRPGQDGKTLIEPEVGLTTSALLFNGKDQPQIGSELRKELTTADDVDLLCSFIKKSGLALVEKRLAEVVGRGGKIRILTTTYMGATQKSAVDALVELGAEVRISYMGDTSRLHAKAWIIHRNTGASTAYVGSSNLSAAAMKEGLEWNVRLSEREQPHLISTIAATFEDHWNDNDFSSYDPILNGVQLEDALARAKSNSTNTIAINFANIDVSPYPYQMEVLDDLRTARELHGRSHNLVVMATGTGKTIVAALDFRRLYESGEVKSLLFVAHRKEILQQSLQTFRAVLKEGSFGELLVDGMKPSKWKFVFGSIQSLSNLDKTKITPHSFDMVIIDEFHHAAAESYDSLLNYLDPKYLLGLTATPERADAKDILKWFGGVTSADLRLGEAINRQILSPFQYFGLHDNIDLEALGVTWKKSRYDLNELSNIYTGNDARVALILKQLGKYVDDLGNTCGLGFCVSIEHAVYMAKKFNEAGLASEAITSKTPSEERDRILYDLKNGQIRFVFAVDIFNEGIDIPQVNTLLMLRPTESATVFIQQLGRGLRKHFTKECVTVLDFVGNQNKNFRFDQKFGRLFGLKKKELVASLQNDFPTLPAGCHFELDEVAREIVLKNLQNVVRRNDRQFESELKSCGDVSIQQFLNEMELQLTDLYRNDRCMTRLRRNAFGEIPEFNALEETVAKNLKRCLHIDDFERIEIWREIIGGEFSKIQEDQMMMVAYQLFGSKVTVTEAVDNFAELRGSAISREVLELLDVLATELSHLVITTPASGLHLAVHGTYGRDEALASFGVRNPSTMMEGVKWIKDRNADLAFVTLNKDEKHYSPTTMYLDRAITDRIFQWESQSTTSESSPTGQRYINHVKTGSTFHLFVRSHRTEKENSVTMPYRYLGPATYMSHTGSRPLKINWNLQYAIPAELFVKLRTIAS